MFKLSLTADNGYRRVVEIKKEVGQRPGRLVECFSMPGSFIYGITREDEYLWMTDVEANKIYKVEEEGGRVVRSISVVEYPTGICYDKDRKVLWVHSLESKKIYKIEPTTGTLLDSSNSPANTYPTGLAYDGELLYVVDMAEYKIYKVNPENGASVGEFLLPSSLQVRNGPRGLAFEGRAPNGGSLLLVMTYYTQGSLDSTYLWEITREGKIVGGEKIDVAGGRAIEISSNEKYYWVSDVKENKVCKIVGFYPRTGVKEEMEGKRGYKFTLKSNPTHFPVIIRITPILKKGNVKIYSVDGRLIRKIEVEGREELIWWGYDDRGEKVKSGIYFLKIGEGVKGDLGWEKIVVVK